MSTNYNTHKIPVESGVNDVPIAPTSTTGCNGAYYVEKYHNALDAIALDIDGKFDIPAGTTVQYVRGDGTLATLNTDDNTVKISSADTTASYLENALVAGTNITLTKNNSGGNETITIAASSGGGSESYRIINGNSFVSIPTINSDITFQRANNKSGVIASNNTFFGYASNISLSSGTHNTAMGYLAGANITTTYGNTYLGSGAGGSIAGDANIAIGVNAFQGPGSDRTGNDNIAIGSQALGALIVGNNNIGIGAGAGFDSWSTPISGSNNIIIGRFAYPANPTDSNTITLGNSSHTVFRSNVTSITSLSDARDKTNIQPLPLGLNFINTLNPVTYQWDKREWYESNVSDGTKVAPELNAGFIAQDLQAAQTEFNADYLKLVYDSNPDKLEATPGNLLFVAIKAIQELSTELTEVRSQLALLQGV